MFLLLICFLFSTFNDITAEEPHKLVIATWNIGHFSNGHKSYSLIPHEQLDSMRRQYRQLIYDSINASIICINEYSAEFCQTRSKKVCKTKRILFNDYKYKEIGSQYNYGCNAIFSNVKLRNIKERQFECNTNNYHTKTGIGADYYYLCGDLLQNKTKVTIICAHLVPKNSKLRKAQMNELISIYQKCDKVIMCGDWNTWDFLPFKKAGFQMANDGTFVTFPSKLYALDNIIVKGFSIDCAKVIKTGLSDHYPLICTITDINE